MADVLTPECRSLCMSRIRGAHTKPELQVRKLLFAKGFRYKLNDRSLPGKPDLVLPKYNAVVLVHGCFWHGHRCQLFKIPETNRDFWIGKINKNRLNDTKARHALRKAGWRILTVWECALRGTRKLDPSKVANAAALWIRSGSSLKTIRA